MIRNHYNDALSRSDQDQNLHFPKNLAETVMSGYFFFKDMTEKRLSKKFVPTTSCGSNMSEQVTRTVGR